MNPATEIRLRVLTGKDSKNLAILANNRNVWNNLRGLMPHPYLETDAVDFIAKTTKETPQQNFAIEYNKNLCGVIGILLQSDVYAGTGEIGYWIGEPFWSKGIATEAIRLMCTYGFTQLGLRRIYASVFSFNAASMKVLEKNGFIKEGIRHSAIIKNCVISDDHLYALIK